MKDSSGVDRADGPADEGRTMFAWAQDLWPLNRSLTGDGFRASLDHLARLLPGLTSHEVPTGTKALDWTVPDEWNFVEAFIADEAGQRLVDTATSNLHVVGYSEPIDRWVDRETLEQHLHSLPDQPDAVPYVTSYYRRTWGFCLAHDERERLGPGPFHVKVDATLGPGSLTYGELVLPGETSEEILLSTYLCHPSMANNELSGPVVLTALARWLAALPVRRFTYRILFLPETIGSVVYLSRHLEHLRANVRAGWVVTCIGDERTYSYVPSRRGGTLADRVSLRVLADRGDFDAYSFLDRGSDERQWCSPGADLPVCSVMRSKYGTYAEYHTSLDRLGSVVTPDGLQGGLDVLRDCLTLLEANDRWRCVTPGEPQLGRRGLYPTTSMKGSADSVRSMMNVLAYCDGDLDIIDLCERTGEGWRTVLEVVGRLAEAGLITRVAGQAEGTAA